MKKFMLKFADGLLSKEQMKKVRGGCGGGGGCGMCLDGNTTGTTGGETKWVGCFGSNGNCSCPATTPQSGCM